MLILPGERPSLGLHTAIVQADQQVLVMQKSCLFSSNKKAMRTCSTLYSKAEAPVLSSCFRCSCFDYQGSACP